MTVKPSEMSFKVSVCPLVSLYDADEVMVQFMKNRVPAHLREKARSFRHYINLVNQEIDSMHLPVSVRCVFVDGETGIVTDRPDLIDHPVLMITTLNAEGHVFQHDTWHH